MINIIYAVKYQHVRKHMAYAVKQKHIKINALYKKP